MIPFCFLTMNGYHWAFRNRKPKINHDGNSQSENCHNSHKDSFIENASLSITTHSIILQTLVAFRGNLTSDLFPTAL